eukprot:364416-Chlamydomonas_euryale.AAC.2
MCARKVLPAQHPCAACPVSCPASTLFACHAQTLGPLGHTSAPAARMLGCLAWLPASVFGIASAAAVPSSYGDIPLHVSARLGACTKSSALHTRIWPTLRCVFPVSGCKLHSSLLASMLQALRPASIGARCQVLALACNACSCPQCLLAPAMQHVAACVLPCPHALTDRLQAV